MLAYRLPLLAIYKQPGNEMGIRAQLKKRLYSVAIACNQRPAGNQMVTDLIVPIPTPCATVFPDGRRALHARFGPPSRQRALAHRTPVCLRLNSFTLHATQTLAFVLAYAPYRRITAPEPPPLQQFPKTDCDLSILSTPSFSLLRTDEFSEGGRDQLLAVRATDTKQGVI